MGSFKGACWLLIMQPLLKLSERATQLAKNPEALEAVEDLIEAYGETHNQGAPILYMAIEKLENAVGGERRLAELLGQPRPYIGDLKQWVRHSFLHREKLRKQVPHDPSHLDFSLEVR
jgi:hypothetical protein